MMHLFLLTLFLLAAATTQSPRSSDFVYITIEAGWVEGSLDTSGLQPTIDNLEYSLDLVKRYVFFSKSDDLKAVGKVVKNIHDSVQSSFIHVRNKLKNLGFRSTVKTKRSTLDAVIDLNRDLVDFKTSALGEDIMVMFEKSCLMLYNSLMASLDHSRDKLKAFGFPELNPLNRDKRSPMNFVSNLGSYLFGFVGADQYEQLRKTIKNDFENIYSEESLSENMIHENRIKINAILKLHTDFSEQYNKAKDTFWNASKFLVLIMQISLAMESLKDAVLLLGQIRTSADQYNPSRHVIDSEFLKSNILLLNNDYESSAVFNTDLSDLYYNLRLATTCWRNDTISQILRIPLISNEAKFRVTNDKCISGHVCLDGALGHVVIPITTYLGCPASNLDGVATICLIRPCATSQDAVCHSLNTTTFVVATRSPFEAVLKCETDSRILITKVTVLTVPTECRVESSGLKIPKVKSATGIKVKSASLDVPFTFNNGMLKLNDSSVQYGLLQEKHISDLLVTKLLPDFVPHTQVQLAHRAHFYSTASFGISATVLIALIAVGIILAVKRILSRYGCIKAVETVAIDRPDTTTKDGAKDCSDPSHFPKRGKMEDSNIE